jgi:hypothetical protein
MSTSNQTANSSASNFTAIFDAAEQEYKTLTKQDLGAHPFAAALEEFKTPDAILGIFRKQAQAFDQFQKGDDQLMACLTPTVNILFTFSATLGEGVCLVSHCFLLCFRSPTIVCSSAILASEDHFHRNRCPSCRKFTPILP